MAKRPRAIDKAKEYREKVAAQYALIADPWTVPGLRPHPNTRTLFIQMLGKERAGRLFKLIAARSDSEISRGFVGFGFDNCILVLPSGEKMIAVSCNRHGATVEERGTDFSPQLDFSLGVLRDLAAETGRLSAMISTDTAQPLVGCSDGRQIPLAACQARPLAHDD